MKPKEKSSLTAAFTYGNSICIPLESTFYEFEEMLEEVSGLPRPNGKEMLIGC